jgi:chromosome segregation ATPase
MTDEKSMPETLETIAQRITALGRSMDERFTKVDEHFTSVEGRFTKVDERFMSVEGRFTQMDERFAQMDERFTDMDEHFTKVDGRLANIDGRLTKIDGRLTTHDQQFESIDQRLSDLKTHLGVKIESVEARIDLVYDAVIALQQDTLANATDHERFTARVDNHEIRLLALERRKPTER